MFAAWSSRFRETARLINADPVSLIELGAKLDGIFQTRAVHLAYVTAETDVAFGDVAAVRGKPPGSLIPAIHSLSDNGHEVALSETGFSHSAA